MLSLRRDSTCRLLGILDVIPQLLRMRNPTINVGSTLFADLSYIVLQSMS